MQFSERNKKTMYIGLAKVNRLTPREESLPGASGFNTQRTLSQWFCCRKPKNHKIWINNKKYLLYHVVFRAKSVPENDTFLSHFLRISPAAERKKAVFGRTL